MQSWIDMLRASDDALRYEAAQQLSAYHAEATVNALVAALHDPNGKVRYAALSSLVKIGDARALQPTLLALLEQPDSRVWGLLTLDIGMRLRTGLLEMVQHGDTDLAAILLTALAAPPGLYNEPQRALLVRLLGRTGDDRLVEPMIDALLGGSAVMAGAAGEALGYIRDRGAIPPLLAAIGDADSKLREIIINALGRLGAGEGTPMVVDTLLPFLDSADEWTRRAAADALGHMGDTRAVRPLLHLLEDDESQLVQDAADGALGRLIQRDRPTPDVPSDQA